MFCCNFDAVAQFALVVVVLTLFAPGLVPLGYAFARRKWWLALLTFPMPGLVGSIALRVAVAFGGLSAGPKLRVGAVDLPVAVVLSLAASIAVCMLAVRRVHQAG